MHLEHHYSKILFFFPALAAAIGPTASAELPPPPVTYDTALAPMSAVLVHPGCSGNAFFVETEEHSPACPGFANRLADLLRPLFQAKYCEWNVNLGITVPVSCVNTPGTRELVDSQASVQVEPVFDPPRDGSDRFFRVHFERESTRLVIPKEWSCAAIQLLRQQASIAAAQVCSASFKFRIGRECPVVPLAPPSDWHLTAMNVQPPGSSPAGPPAQVALLDTGIDDVLAASGVRRVSVPKLDNDRSGSNRHRHGSVMASLIRQVAPQATIHSIRVFDSQNVATTASLARGIEYAALNLSPPLVVNLSLGWAPEHSAQRKIEGYSAATLDPDVNGMIVSPTICKEKEDGIGQSVKFALDLARRRDALVIAAAGNRPPFSQAVAVAVLNAFVEQPEAVLKQMFYPAQWGVVTSSNAVSLAVAAGSHTARSTRSSLSRGLTAALLFAPGEHVYVPPGAGKNARAASYTMSGTSVSAALLSGVAARARAESPQLSASKIAVLLSWGGVDNTGGWKRISMCRVLHVLNTPSCAGSIPDLAAPYTSSIDSAACLPDGCAKAPIVRWSTELFASGTRKTKITLEPKEPCPPTQACFDQWTAAPLGPQPTNGGCPDCNLDTTLTGAVLGPSLLSGKIFDYNTGTMISEPYLEVYAQDTVLTNQVLSASVAPGLTMNLQIPPIVLPDDTYAEEDIKVKLILKITPPGGPPGVWDASELWLEFDP
jgi:hypothetical protein